MTTVELLKRRWDGTFDVDEWGLDPDMVEMASPVFTARWSIEVDGAHQVPDVGPAAVVFNRRVGLSEPFVLSRGLRLATGRFVRTVGVPDVAPVGTVLRRLGGVLDRRDEVAGLLRAGEVVAQPLDREVRLRHRAGRLDAEALGASVETGAPVVPVAVIGREAGRRWRICVGEPIDPPDRPGPLAVAELVDLARHRVQDLLDEALPPTRAFGR